MAGFVRAMSGGHTAGHYWYLVLTNTRRNLIWPDLARLRLRRRCAPTRQPDIFYAKHSIQLT
eukprot:scaffold169376_cov50-Attheya_sp.AAC.1